MKYSPLRTADGRPDISPRQAALASWGLALVALLSGCQEWISPSAVPQTGSSASAWLHAYCIELLGPKGLAFFWVGFAALLFAMGVLSWMRHKRGIRQL